MISTLKLGNPTKQTKKHKNWVTVNKSELNYTLSPQKPPSSPVTEHVPAGLSAVPSEPPVDMPADWNRCRRWRLRSAAAHVEPPAVVVVAQGRRGEEGAGMLYNWLHFSPSPSSYWFFFKQRRRSGAEGGQKREGWVRTKHPCPLGNTGRREEFTLSCLLLRRLVGSFMPVTVNGVKGKSRSSFTSARLLMIQHSYHLEIKQINPPKKHAPYVHLRVWHLLWT